VSERLEDVRLHIGGRYVEAGSGRTFETINPATSQPLATVHEADAGDVDRAASGARTAPPRSSTTAS
jgi:acyl-CoA reductase-like NAD-dependent aldehyde dehydrogenase